MSPNSPRARRPARSGGDPFPTGRAPTNAAAPMGPMACSVPEIIGLGHWCPGCVLLGVPSRLGSPSTSDAMPRASSTIPSRSASTRGRHGVSPTVGLPTRVHPFRPGADGFRDENSRHRPGGTGDLCSCPGTARRVPGTKSARTRSIQRCKGSTDRCVGRTWRLRRRRGGSRELRARPSAREPLRGWTHCRGGGAVPDAHRARWSARLT